MVGRQQSRLRAKVKHFIHKKGNAQQYDDPTHPRAQLKDFFSFHFISLKGSFTPKMDTRTYPHYRHHTHTHSKQAVAVAVAVQTYLKPQVEKTLIFIYIFFYVWLLVLLLLPPIALLQLCVLCRLWRRRRRWRDMREGRRKEEGGRSSSSSSRWVCVNCGTREREWVNNNTWKGVAGAYDLLLTRTHIMSALLASFSTLLYSLHNNNENIKKGRERKLGTTAAADIAYCLHIRSSFRFPESF